MKISNLIETEKTYFQEILTQRQGVSPEQKENFRSETVSQRKERLSDEIYTMLGGVVKFGPFAGMHLSSDTWWGKSDLGSMLLGTYELEILNFIGGLKQTEFDNFIDIGAADGYYACGLLHAGKAKRAICFEINDFGRQVIKKNWELNGSPYELEIYSEATAESLSRITNLDFSRTLILVDIEGAEFTLLRDKFLRVIEGATIIVEVHDWHHDFASAYGEMLQEMSKYFYLKIVEPIDRPANTLPILRGYTDENRALLLTEGRPSLMRFLLLHPRR